MSVLEILLEISRLATEDKLDAFLDEHGFAEFEESSASPTPRKFGSRPTFDRSVFDYEAYSLEIEQQLKK